MLPYKILKTKSKLPLRVKTQQELDLKKMEAKPDDQINAS